MKPCWWVVTAWQSFLQWPFESTFIIQYAQDLVIQEKDDTINTSFSTVGFKHDLLVYHNYWALFCLQLCLDKGELNCMYYLQRINSLLGYDKEKLNCMCSLQRIEGSILDYGRQASGKSSESKHSERLGIRESGLHQVISAPCLADADWALYWVSPVTGYQGA